MKKVGLTFLLIITFVLMLVGCSQESTGSPAEESSDVGTSEEQTEASFPQDTIRLILPIASGGTYDTMGRILASHLPKYLPNDYGVVVENKSGGNNTLGVVEVFNAEPDGYTIGYIPTSTVTLLPHVAETPYTHDSFQTIARVHRSEGFLFVREDSQWDTFEDWMEYVKQNPDQFTVAAVAGARPSLEKMQKLADINFRIVAFDASSQALTALLGGHVDATVGTWDAQLKAQVDEGVIRPIFSTSGVQTTDVPILNDKGIPIISNRMTGVIAPKGIPEDVLNILQEAFKKTLEDPEVLAEFDKIAVTPDYGGPEEFQKEITETFEIDGEQIRSQQ